MLRGFPVLLVVYNVEQEDGYWWLPPLQQSALEVGTDIVIPVSQRFSPAARDQIRRALEPRLWPSVRSRLPRPLELSAERRNELFRFKLADLPRPFVNEDKLDVLAVTGPALYDIAKYEDRFRPVGNCYQDTLLYNRIELGESAYNIALTSEILGTLCHLAGSRGAPIPTHRMQIPYPEVSDSMLEAHNVILVSCGDTNPLVPLAYQRFEMLNQCRVPVHHSPYESSQSVCDELTIIEGLAQEYEKKDSAAGLITLLPNPWNNARALLICGGNRGTGSQAALLRLLNSLRGRGELRDRHGVPAVVVRGILEHGFHVVDVADV